METNLQQIIGTKAATKAFELAKIAKKTKKSADYEVLKLFLVGLNDKFKEHSLDGANVAHILVQSR